MYFECLVTGVSEPKKGSNGKDFQTVFLTDSYNERWTAFMPENFESYCYEKEEDDGHRKFCYLHLYNAKNKEGNWVTNSYIAHKPIKF